MDSGISAWLFLYSVVCQGGEVFSKDHPNKPKNDIQRKTYSRLADLKKEAY